VFAELINWNKVTRLFVVPAVDLGKDLSGSAFLPACYIADVFGIDDL
jgi:hypothetical protein